ncbi:WXG100 family type VII secretion target [Kitasatospora sp. NPDC056327]|uniref:WXG100 family type VII secretion target n=1 Tax=Kitasatospora sp. NPDC056327 TaxID=3345785 RepID=UPI0035E05D79
MATQDNTTTTGQDMSGYKVTLDDVSAAATYVQGQAEAIDQKIAALRGYVNGLGVCWQGSAHAAFEVLMKDYDVYATLMHDALRDISSGLNGNYVNYAASEEANLRNLRHVELPPAKF